MAEPVSFDAYLGWVNISDPNNIPQDARVISADDLLRYEKLGKDTAAKFAEVDSTLESLVIPENTAARYYDLRAIFEGMQGYAYGNSYIAGDYNNSLNYPLRLPAKLGIKGMTRLATSGYRMQDTVTDAVGTTAKSWVAGTPGLVVVGDLLNNLMEPDTAANRAAALEGMRALVAVLSASSRVEETTSTFSGWSAEWSNILSANDFSGGSTRYINKLPTTKGDVLGSVKVSVPEGVNYLLVGSTTEAAPGALLVISQDGVTLTSADTSRKAMLSQYRATQPRNPMVVRIPGSGARTLDVTAIAQETTTDLRTYAFMDALLPQSPNPPVIVLVKPAKISRASHNKPSLLTYLRTVPDLVAAEFGNHVIVVDPAPGWNEATMLGSDQLHPNELGQEHWANAVADGVMSTVTSRMFRQALQPAGARETIMIAPTPPPAATVYVADTFTRANSSTTLGSTTTGNKSWEPLLGTWGIKGNAAYDVVPPAAGTNHYAVVNSGQANGTISMRVSATNIAGNKSGIIFRLTDTSNYLCWLISGSMFKCEGGIFTNLGSFPQRVPTSGDQYEVVLDGSSIKAKVNGQEYGAAMSAFNQGVTKHGLISAGGDGSHVFDDYSHVA